MTFDRFEIDMWRTRIKWLDACKIAFGPMHGRWLIENNDLSVTSEATHHVADCYHEMIAATALYKSENNIK